MIYLYIFIGFYTLLSRHHDNEIKIRNTRWGG